MNSRRTLWGDMGVFRCRQGACQTLSDRESDIARKNEHSAALGWPILGQFGIRPLQPWQV